MVDKIFDDDPRFHEHHKKEGKHHDDASSGFSHLAKGFKSIFIGFFHIFSKKIPMNLFFLLVIIGIVIFGVVFFHQPEIITEQVETTLECPEVVCEDQNCSIYDEQTCIDEFNLTIKTEEENVSDETGFNKFFYVCPSGSIVNETDECSKYPVNVTSKNHAIANNVILTLDSFDLEYDEDDDLYSLRRVDVTVSNLDNELVIPEIHIKIYEDYDDVRNDLPLRKIKFDDVLKINDVVSKIEPMILSFEDIPQTMRLELFNTLPDPDVSLAVITEKLTSNDIS